MKKNRVMFFETAILGVVAVFLFSVTFAPSQARAYVVGSSTSDVPGPTGGTFDVGSSLQNLISPFTGFVNSLKGNNTISGPNGMSITLPAVNITPVVSNDAQNLVGQWLTQFDNWFYGVSGVQLSGIMVALLSLFSWALGLAQQAVSWLQGLFR